MRALTASPVDRQLRPLGTMELENEVLDPRLLAELAELKDRYAADLARLRAKCQRWVAALEAQCRAARGGLFGEGVQTVRLGFGQVSYRDAGR